MTFLRGMVFSIPPQPSPLHPAASKPLAHDLQKLLYLKSRTYFTVFHNLILF